MFHLFWVFCTFLLICWSNLKIRAEYIEPNDLFQQCLQEVEGVLAGNVLIEFAIGLKVAPVQKGRGGGAGARYNFEENDVNCKRSSVAAQRLVAQEHLFRNIFFLSLCIFGIPLHIIGCGSEAKYNLTVTTCQKCLKTGHLTSSLYKKKTYFFLAIRIRIEYSFTEENVSHYFTLTTLSNWLSYLCIFCAVKDL